MIVDVEQRENSPLVSLLPEDVMRKQVVSFLTIGDVVKLDTAFVNRNLRNYFLACLIGAVLEDIVDYRYLDWFKARKCSAKVLRVTSALDNDSNFVTASSFEKLIICPTAKVSAHALHALLTGGKCFKILDARSYYTLNGQQLTSLSFDLPLLEINAKENEFLPEDVLVALVKRCPLLEVIIATGCLQYTKLLHLALAEFCPHLREVTLQTHKRSDNVPTGQPNTSGYCELFQSCKQLKVVHCSGDVRISNLQSLADCSKQLISVRLHGMYTNFNLEEECSELVDAALILLVQNNRSIELLELSSFPHLSDETLLAVAKYLPDLHTFRVHCPLASPFTLEAIRSSCLKLTTFQVYDYQRFDTLVATPAYAHHQDYSIMTHLYIHPAILSDVQFVALARNNPSMRSLYIISSYEAHTMTKITSIALTEPFSYLQNLEMFYVQKCMRNLTSTDFLLENGALLSLVHHCSHLSSIYVPGQSSLSNEAITALSNLPLLRSLDVSECVNLLDSGIEAISKGCPLLEDINFSDCKCLSDVAINAVAQYSRRLTSVVLWRCPEVTNSAIQNLVRRARQLERLSIAFNPRLTFAAVAELPIYCYCMREVRLFSNPRKPGTLELDASYRNNRRYFDIVFGWSDELQPAVAW